MAINRYQIDDIMNFGKNYGTTKAMQIIRNGISNGNISYETVLIRGGERLDTIAGEIYGNGSLWWIIAAASDIGWCLQVPAGTIINLPNPQHIATIFV